MPQARYSFVAARPMLIFRSFGSRCELDGPGERAVWKSVACPGRIDGPLRIAGGNRPAVSARRLLWLWGYDLKNFVEPRLPRTAVNDIELPDCQAGFYDSLVVFDHRLDKVWIISTGLTADGSRSEARTGRSVNSIFGERILPRPPRFRRRAPETGPCRSNFSRDEFIALARRAQEYIRQGDIYQVNLSQRLSVKLI
jgi:para-aminobenzoate synthetase component 1